MSAKGRFELDDVAGGIIFSCLEDHGLDADMVGILVLGSWAWVPVDDLEEVFVEVVGGHVVVDEGFPGFTHQTAKVVEKGWRKVGEDLSED